MSFGGKNREVSQSSLGLIGPTTDKLVPFEFNSLAESCCAGGRDLPTFPAAFGEVAEWFKAHAWKA